MPVTIELTPEVEARLRQEAARIGLEPQAYVARALEQHFRSGASNGNGAGASSSAGPSGPALGAREADLLRQINVGLPAESWALYRQLLGKRDAEALTPAEQQQLVDLSDAIEEANARRLGHLAELARLRGVELETLLRDLGIAGGRHG